MGVFADISYLFSQGYGWLFLLFVGLYELYAPTVLNQDTALAPIVRDIPEKVDDVKEKQEQARTDINDVRNNVQEVQERQKVQMQVQRAQARANDEMDAEKVDDYLLHNGVSVDSFLGDDNE